MGGVATPSYLRNTGNTDHRTRISQVQAATDHTRDSDTISNSLLSTFLLLVTNKSISFQQVSFIGYETMSETVAKLVELCFYLSAADTTSVVEDTMLYNWSEESLTPLGHVG